MVTAEFVPATSPAAALSAADCAARAGVSRASHYRHLAKPHVDRARRRLREASYVGDAFAVLDVLLEVARRTSGLNEVSSDERQLFYSLLAQLLGRAAAPEQEVPSALLAMPKPRLEHGDDEARLATRELVPLFALRAASPARLRRRHRAAETLSDDELLGRAVELGLTLPPGHRWKLGEKRPGKQKYGLGGSTF